MRSKHRLVSRFSTLVHLHCVRAFSHYKKAYADLFKPAPPPGDAAVAAAEAAAAAPAAAPDEAAAAVEGDSKAPAGTGTDAPAPDVPPPSSEPEVATSGLDSSRPRQLSGVPTSPLPPPLFDPELEYGWRVFVCLRSKLLLLQGASDLVTATNGLIVTLVGAVGETGLG